MLLVFNNNQTLKYEKKIVNIINCQKIVMNNNYL